MIDHHIKMVDLYHRNQVMLRTTKSMLSAALMMMIRLLTKNWFPRQDKRVLSAMDA
jgi:hypothetical protein